MCCASALASRLHFTFFLFLLLFLLSRAILSLCMPSSYCILTLALTVHFTLTLTLALTPPVTMWLLHCGCGISKRLLIYLNSSPAAIPHCLTPRSLLVQPTFYWLHTNLWGAMRALHSFVGVYYLWHATAILHYDSVAYITMCKYKLFLPNSVWGQTVG